MPTQDEKWLTKQGEIIKVSDMEDRHARFTLNMLLRLMRGDNLRALRAHMKALQNIEEAAIKRAAITARHTRKEE